MRLGGAIVLVAVAVSACADPAAPTLPDGIYRLVGVNGQAAPGALPSTSASCDVSLEEGILHLRGDAVGEFYFSYWRGLSCPGFGGSGTYFNQTGFFGTMTRRGSAVEFESLLPSGVAMTFGGSLGADGLTLMVQDTSLGFAGSAELRFVYQGAFPELTPP